MWVLILTLATVNTQSGSAITTQDGFATEKVCLAAGNAWIEQMNKANIYPKARALCVRLN